MKRIMCPRVINKDTRDQVLVYVTHLRRAATKQLAKHTKDQTGTNYTTYTSHKSLSKKLPYKKYVRKLARYRLTFVADILNNLNQSEGLVRGNNKIIQVPDEDFNDLYTLGISTLLDVKPVSWLSWWKAQLAH